MTLDPTIEALADEELVSTTHRWVVKSREVDARLLLLLGEIDARQLYLRRAFPSMFSFCVAEFGFSEEAAFNRVRVARVARLFPAVMDAFRSGRVHLTGLRLLAPHLTHDNHASLLELASGKSKREIETLVARLAPKPLVADSVRKLPTSAVFTAPPTPAPEHRAEQTKRMGEAAPSALFSLTPAPTRAAAVKPLDGDHYKVQFTANQALRDKLREAQDLLGHANVDGELAVVIERAVDLLVADLKRKRFGVARRPKPENTPSEQRPGATRHIPNAIKRAVYARDNGRCTFVDPGTGRRCGETRRVEFDHVDGFARTRVHSVEGLRLRCRPHNQYAAVEMYGADFIEEARRRRKTPKVASTRPGTGESAAGPAQGGERFVPLPLDLKLPERSVETG